jgi:phosphopantetheinyl transferase
MQRRMELAGPFDPRHLGSPPLIPGQVHYWFQDLANEILCLNDGTSGPSFCLSSEELDRAGRFHRHEDRAVFLLSRRNLRRICSHYEQLRADAVRIEIHEGGKPFILGEDGRPALLKFNVSHSGSSFLAAFCRGQEVGTDIECAEIADDSLALAAQICTRREIAYLESVHSAARMPAFLQIWARKEAIAKGSGLGLSLPLPEIDSRYPADSSNGELFLATHDAAGRSRHSSRRRTWQLFSPLPAIRMAASVAVEIGYPTYPRLQ